MRLKPFNRLKSLSISLRFCTVLCHTPTVSADWDLAEQPGRSPSYGLGTEFHCLRPVHEKAARSRRGTEALQKTSSLGRIPGIAGGKAEYQRAFG